ncbi:hypothetical protein [Roseofilum sp. Guam]|uniref:hypothetical protein n=1 Tax=Roseofilum sp. Guam TaxID=2821502 RepID=UPI001B2156FB|nr:hypothetical protein [Roseofilum sp. Guam]MBP0031206.1 hypothetical protein [Roseofilum sp. Guam]
MPFTGYKNLAMVIQAFELNYQETNFILPSEFTLNDYFKQRFEALLTEGIVDNSEAAICENLIAPILTEVWFSYKQNWLLWSHQSLSYDEDLSGVPDYILAHKSPLGKIVFEQPFFVAIEAKKDDFTAGWGQCGAEMVACQKINGIQEQTIFGIVSNGKVWEFGKLSDRAFTKNLKAYTIYDLERLFNAVNYVFEQCQLQVNP